MPSRTLVAFLTPTLGRGGAEKVLVDLIGRLDRDRFEVSCYVLGTESTTAFDLRSDTAIHYLNRRGKRDIPRTLVRLRECLRTHRPDVVIASTWSANVSSILVQGARRDFGLILWEQIAPTQMFSGRTDWLKKVLIRLLYPKADLVVAASEGVRDELIHTFDLPRGRTIYVHNGVDTKEVRKLGQEPIEEEWFHEGVPCFVSVGRLEDQKDFPTLLRAFRLLKGEARLLIVGGGSRRNDLLSLRDELGIVGDCKFVGERVNPYAYMKRAFAFVLSSRFEGFGIVLAEALALGIPVIATDCPHGPAEVLSQDAGIIVPVGDPTRLAEAMARLLRDSELREALHERGLQRAAAFDIGETARKFERVIGIVRSGEVSKYDPYAGYAADQQPDD